MQKQERSKKERGKPTGPIVTGDGASGEKRGVSLDMQRPQGQSSERAQEKVGLENRGSGGEAMLRTGDGKCFSLGVSRSKATGETSKRVQRTERSRNPQRTSRPGVGKRREGERLNEFMCRIA